MNRSKATAGSIFAVGTQWRVVASPRGTFGADFPFCRVPNNGLVFESDPMMQIF
jgi:hypothetical protein